MTEFYTHIKIRILLREHLSTISISLIYLFLFQGIFLIFFIPGFLIFSVIVQFTSKKKFLADIAYNAGSAELIYLTPNLKLNKEELDLNQVANAEVSRAGYLMKYPLELTIKYKGKWKSYYIIDKRTVKVVNTFLDAANFSF